MCCEKWYNLECLFACCKIYIYIYIFRGNISDNLIYLFIQSFIVINCLQLCLYSLKMSGSSGHPPQQSWGSRDLFRRSFDLCRYRDWMIWEFLRLGEEKYEAVNSTTMIPQFLSSLKALLKSLGITETISLLSAEDCAIY